MSDLPAWNVPLFGCLTRDNASVESLMRTQVTASLPVPWVSRKGDTSAPVIVTFGIDVTDAAFRAWQQWWTYDLAEGILTFTTFIPWGVGQPRVRARLLGGWSASRLDGLRWLINGQMEVERWTLPRFSGGAHA